MAKNQDINDGGSIIGYRPDLKYKTDRNSTEEQSKRSVIQYDALSDTGSYSKTLTNFIDSAPNAVLHNLAASSEYMQKLIEKLSNAFPNGTYQEYGSIQAFLNALMVGNDEFAMEFMNWHKHDISGSQIPELMHCIYCGKKRIDVLSQTVKDLYYANSNITALDAKEIDDAYIAQMRIYENGDMSNKINYYALAVDTELDRLILIHNSAMRKLVMRTTTIVKEKDDSTVQSANMELIRDLFGEVNSELDSILTTYNNQQGIDILEKSLYNYYQKRKSALNLYTLLNDSHTSSLFTTKLDRKQKDVQDALSNVSRALRATELYTSKFNDLEREKHFLKDVYDSFNYNS